MTGHGFTSVFAVDLDDYLAFKAAMGFTGSSHAGQSSETGPPRPRACGRGLVAFGLEKRHGQARTSGRSG